MPYKSLALSLLVSVVLLCPRALADDDSPLERSMSTMNASLRALKRQVPDPAQNASALELIEKMKKAAVASRDESPAMLNEIPEADRAKFLSSYKDAMTDLIGQIDELNLAVKENRTKDAVKLLDELKETKREGHSQFINKKDKD
ncbi:MAG: cytochrome b562 [Terrimicrobiaceae bacterium]